MANTMANIMQQDQHVVCESVAINILSQPVDFVPPPQLLRRELAMTERLWHFDARKSSKG